MASMPRQSTNLSSERDRTHTIHHDDRRACVSDEFSDSVEAGWHPANLTRASHHPIAPWYRIVFLVLHHHGFINRAAHFCI